MSLSYTTGNPNNLTGGANASMNDIQGPFVDIRTFLTDGSGAVGDTILTSPNNAVWRTVTTCNGGFGGVQLTTTPCFFSNQGSILTSATGAANSGAQSVWTPMASDKAVAGKTARLRLIVAYGTNATASGITITWGLYPVTAWGGAGTAVGVTLGTVIAGSTVSVASPAANGGATLTGTSFDLSALASASHHIIGLVGSGTSNANANVSTSAILEMRHT